jgi:hypothetical protein
MSLVSFAAFLAFCGALLTAVQGTPGYCSRRTYLPRYMRTIFPKRKIVMGKWTLISRE